MPALRSDTSDAAKGRMRLLLALDSSEVTALAALDMARRHEASLTVLFVLDATWNTYVGHDWLSGSGSRADFLDWIREEESKAADAALEAFRRLADGFPFETRTAGGDVQEQILLEAAKGYDLLIMSNPFVRGLELMRNAPPKMAERCPCSLLLVKQPPGKR